MGGAAGHMNHPFDLPSVKNGADLINFFKNAGEYNSKIQTNSLFYGIFLCFKTVLRGLAIGWFLKRFD